MTFAPPAERGQEAPVVGEPLHQVRLAVQHVHRVVRRHGDRGRVQELAGLHAVGAEREHWAAVAGQLVDHAVVLLPHPVLEDRREEVTAGIHGDRQRGS